MFQTRLQKLVLYLDIYFHSITLSLAIVNQLSFIFIKGKVNEIKVHLYMDIQKMDKSVFIEKKVN